MMTRKQNLIPGLIFSAAIMYSASAAACIVTDGQLTAQDGWKIDSKSQGLYYTGVTPTTLSWAGGDATFEETNYVLYYITAGCVYRGVGQQGWRLDSKSQALVYAASLTAKSPAGGTAYTLGSAEYVMYLKGSGEKWVGSKYQDGWYWDSVSSGLFFGEGDAAFNTPGTHANLNNSGEYLLNYY